jgi:hypothetical protein
MGKKLGVSYFAFGIGVVFGAVISTITSYYIFEAALGSPDAASMLAIEDCLKEKFDE